MNDPTRDLHLNHFTNDKRSYLETNFTDHEIKEVVWLVGTWKTLGPDGIHIGVL